MLKEWHVPSKSKRGKWHTVGLVGDKLVCTCFAGQLNKDCSHKKIVKWKTSNLAAIT